MTKMPKDIRSYFSVSSKPSGSSKASKPLQNGTKKSFVVSSDDDVVPPTPEAPRVKKEAPKRRRVVDSDDEKETKTKPNLKKLKDEKKLPEIPKKTLKSLSTMYGDKPVEMVFKKQKTPKKDAFQSDEEFEKLACDLEEVAKPKKTPRKSEERHKTPRKSEEKHKTPRKSEEKHKTPRKSEEKHKTPRKSEERHKTPRKSEERHKTLRKSEEKHKTPKNLQESDFHSDEEFKRTIKTLDAVSEKKKTSKKTPSKTPDHKSSKEEKKESKSSEKAPKTAEKPPKETPAEPPVEDKKKLAGILYQKFKNRSSCINPGSKEVPEGAPDCLSGLSFIITGILESLQREEATQLIKDLGGKVMASVSKKTDFVVLGEEAGPAKLKKIEQFGTKKLTEDGLFDLIRQKSAGKMPRKSPGKRKNEESQEVEAKRKKPEPQELNVTGDVAGSLPWVDKYSPKSSKQIIGQQGAASNLVKLTNWLTKWYTNHDGKKKLSRPSPWAKSDDGAFFKAALLSGPPGVGKTTTATLVCRELGFDVVEFNASDTRSKRLLKEQVSELLSNKSLFGFCHNASVAVSRKHVLLMDEVDGMAGNEDRGGIQELISLIKDSSVPIVCMCNDRNAQKMRSLVNHCFDLRFQRPRVEQIKGAMMSVCFKEKLKLAPGVLDEIIGSTNHDIRQTLNILSMLNAKKDSGGTETGGQNSKKDLKLGPWDVVRKVFSAEEQRKMSIQDRSDLFFHDYSLGPLFVQENYLKVSPRGPKELAIFKAAEAADCLSMGDLVDRRIRSGMNWSLLPTQAIFSSVLPGHFMQGFFTGQIEFPGWLGKNTKRNKRMRLAQEINDHIRITASGSRESVCLDYAPSILAAVATPLKTRGAEGVSQALAVMKEYRLLREDLESLVELSVYPGGKSPLDGVDGKVKAALTRSYNKEVSPYVYSAAVAAKKKRSGGDAEEGLMNEEGEEVAQNSDEDEEDDKIDNDVLIKAKKKTVKKEPEPSTSKGKKATSSSSKAKNKKK